MTYIYLFFDYIRPKALTFLKNNNSRNHISSAINYYDKTINIKRGIGEMPLNAFPTAVVNQKENNDKNQNNQEKNYKILCVHNV